MKRAMIAFLALMASSTAAMAEGGRQPFQKVVESMDLHRFLGSWFVVGVLPTSFEKGAENGIETYRSTRRATSAWNTSSTRTGSGR